jgi:hypothetical protein
MRYVWITLGVAALHRLLVFGIAMLGFGIGMTAFSGNQSASMGMPIMGFAGLLDFPVILAGWIGTKIRTGEYPILQHWGMVGIVAIKSPFIWQAAWSLCVGAMVATAVYFRRLKKYGRQPVSYWKQGL